MVKFPPIAVKSQDLENSEKEKQQIVLPSINTTDIKIEDDKPQHPIEEQTIVAASINFPEKYEDQEIVVENEEIEDHANELLLMNEDSSTLVPGTPFNDTETITIESKKRLIKELQSRTVVLELELIRARTDFEKRQKYASFLDSVDIDQKIKTSSTLDMARVFADLKTQLGRAAFERTRHKLKEKDKA